MNRTNLISLAIGIIGLGVSCISVLLLKENDRTLVNVASLVGSIASVFGLAIAIVQILSVKRVSEVIQEAVQETRRKLIAQISSSELAKTERQIDKAEQAIRDRDRPLNRTNALIIDELIGIKSSLIELENSQQFQDASISQTVSRYKQYIAVEIDNIVGRKVKIDWPKLHRNLEEIRDFVQKCRTELKYK